MTNEVSLFLLLFISLITACVLNAMISLSDDTLFLCGLLIILEGEGSFGDIAVVDIAVGVASVAAAAVAFGVVAAVVAVVSVAGSISGGIFDNGVRYLERMEKD